MRPPQQRPLAAKRPPPPSRFIRDAELEHLRLAGLDHIHRLRDHLALDAAAGDRAEKGPVLVDDEMAADRTRGRTPGLDHRRERNPAILLRPFLRFCENIAFARDHVAPPRYRRETAYLPFRHRWESVRSPAPVQGRPGMAGRTFKTRSAGSQWLGPPLQTRLPEIPSFTPPFPFANACP